MRVAQDVAELFSPACVAKNVDMRCEVDPRVADPYCGDPHRVRQVLSNLVGNAVKFTQSGEIIVRLARLHTDDHADELRLEVVDSGIGIPGERLGRLFYAFSQVDASTARRYGGTGLGLAICHHIATQVGARLDMTSTLGAGTRFSFTVSLQRADPRAGTETGRHTALQIRDLAEPGAPGIHAARYVGSRLLRVDDNEINRELALGMLEMYGVEVDCAEDGLQALELLEKTHYDLVLMDCHMPRMDGYAATREWRERERRQARARTPIVALTAAALSRWLSASAPVGRQLTTTAEAAG